MENTKILKLLKKYLNLKEERKNIQIEISELEDKKAKNNQEIQVKEKSIQSNNHELTLTDKSYDRIINLKKASIELKMFYEDIFSKSFDDEQFNGVPINNHIYTDGDIIDIDKLTQLKKIIEKISSLIGYKNMPSIGDCSLLDKKDLEGKMVRRARISRLVSLMIFVLLVVFNNYISSVFMVNMMLLLFPDALIAGFICILTSGNYDVCVDIPFNEKYDKYLIELNNPNKFNQWILELRKKLLFEIEKEKENLISTIVPNKLLPTGEKFTLDNYKNYRKQLTECEEDIFNLKKHNGITDSLINDKKSKLKLLVQKIDNLKGIILIECSSLTNSREDNDVLEEIKNADIDLYNEIINEKELFSLKENETHKLDNPKIEEEKGKSLIKNKKRKIV